VRSAEQGNAGPGLIRAIGPWALTAFAINATIGAGIFGLPASIQALVGNYSILVIVLCGALIALIALCFAEIGSRFDRTGGPQLYASITFGPVAGFSVGWMFWISRVTSCAAIVNLLVDYGVVLSAPLADPLARALVITAVVAGYTWVNVRGIRQTTAVSTTFTIAKLVPLIGFVAVGLFFVEPSAVLPQARPAATDFATAILLATFPFYGFDATTVLAGEVREPRRSIPFAILLTIGTVVVLYALIQLVCVATLPDLARSERPLAEAATAFVGSRGGIAISLGAVISCLGVFGGVMTPATRLLYAMAEQRQLPAPLSRLHPAFRTPHWAIVLTGVVILVLALSGSFIYLAKLSLISRVALFAITCAVLPTMRRRSDLPEPAFKLPGGSFLGYGSAALCVLFLTASSMRELVDVLIAVVVGLAFFALLRLRQREAPLGNA
jgi:amino acid transporter